MSDFKVSKAVVLASIGLGVLFVPQEGLAQDSKSDEFAKCEELTDASERLKCFERVLRSMKSSRPPAYRPPARETDDSDEREEAPQPEAETKDRFDDFGKRERPKKVEDEERMVATVTRFTEDPNGKFTFYLDNGQVWKETDGSYIEIPRTVTDLGQVTIYKNFMGGFRIKVKNNMKDGRVKRLK